MNIFQKTRGTKMKRSFKFALITMTILPFLGSCGKSSSGDGRLSDEERARRDEVLDETSIDGLYQAKFTTLNPHVNGTIPGSLTFLREKDRLLTFVRLFAGGPRAWHPQGVYLGKRCPNIGDDKNGDGYIDIVEAMAVVGKMIIPLDANINSQASGKNFYPMADLSGYYHYERVASFSRLFDDLKDKDRDPDDHITKLDPNEKFSFERRVFMVQGVVQEIELPETVAGLGKRKPYQTLPITCGIIQKVTGTPGVPDDGEIPGPVAEVIEGQDQPAPAEEDTTAGSSGGTVAGTGTGTNDNEDGEVGDDQGSRGGSTSGRSTTGGTTSGGSTTGGSTSGGSTTGGFIGGFIGGSSGGQTGGTSGGESSGGSTGGSTSGGFIGGFIGGSSGGSEGDTDSSLNQ
jgi:hypothetical protein